MGSYRRLWTHVLSYRYHQEEDDDDFWSCREVQELPGLRYAGLEERGLHVLDEGRRSQRPPRCGRRWCLGWFRQVLRALHQVENRIRTLPTCNRLNLHYIV